jgi:hypothetical protein
MDAATSVDPLPYGARTRRVVDCPDRGTAFFRLRSKRIQRETPTRADRDKLFLPLIALAAVCVLQAIVIAWLLGRGSRGGRAAPGEGSPPVAAAPASPAGDAAGPASPPPAPPAAGHIARGKVGDRVESAGVALTVVAVTHEPQYKEVFTPPAGQQFVGVEVLLENTGTTPHKYFSTSFQLKDPQSRTYNGNALGVADPPLGYGTLVPTEKVRGHLAFVVPKDVTGLTLTYTPGDAGSVYVELGQ